MSDWKTDKLKADKYWPFIKKIIKSVAGQIINVETASDELDQKEATDYIVTISSGHIGCRVRQPGVWPKYKDITFRASRPSGTATELEKLKQGYCRWYLYIWAANKGLAAWVFLDMDLVRQNGILEPEWPTISNRDDSSSFVAIPLDIFDRRHCIVKKS